MNDARDQNLKPAMDEITPLPSISDATFSLAAALDAGETVTIEVTRSKDAVVSTCDLVEAEKPEDHCTQTAFDDVYFEFLDTMPKSGRTSDEAKERKPSKQHCGTVEDSNDDQCKADMKVLAGQLNAAAKQHDQDMDAVWKLTQNIIKIEKKTGVSVFNNLRFVEWILNHEAELWDC